jgi:hypothetical protein
MGDSTLSLFDNEEGKAVNGLPYIDFKAFIKKYARATETMIACANHPVEDYYAKVRYSGRSWQKFKFFVKFIHAVLYSPTPVTYCYTLKRAWLATGCEKEASRAITGFLQKVWDNLDIHYCPKMEVIMLLAESCVHQV